MNTELFKHIAKCFSLSDIFLYDSLIYRNPDFIPPYQKPEKIKSVAQYRNWNESSQLFDVDGKAFAKFKYNVGFRVIDDNDADNEEAEHMVECTSSYLAIYSVIEKVTQSELESFGHYNVGYHVWPYWREYANSTASKLGIGKLTIPLYKIPEFEADSK